MTEKEKKWDGIVCPVVSPLAKSAKGKIVSTIEHPTTKRTAVIRLNGRFMDFWTIVGDDYFQSKSGEEVKRWAMHFLGKGEIAEWLPVIEIHTDSDPYYGGSNRKHAGKASVTIDRYWIAKTNAGSWRRLEWEKGDPNSTVAVAPEDRMAESKDFSEGNSASDNRFGDRNRKAFALPYKSYGRYYLPYDEAQWQGFLRIIESIKNIGATLKAAIETKEGLAAISAGAPNALLLSAKTGKQATTEEIEEADFEIEDNDGSDR